MDSAIKRTNLKHFLNDLKKYYQIVAPQKKKDEVIFDFIENGSDIELEYENLAKRENSLLPVKKFLIPEQEDIFIYDNENKNLIEKEIPKNKALIFGLSLTEAKSIAFLDEIMSNPLPDYFYFRNRNKYILIIISEHPVKNEDYTGDLILEKINKYEYKAIAITDDGKKIAKSRWFGKSEYDQEKIPALEKTTLQELIIDPELLKDAVEWSRKNSKIWDELAETCLGCGICTYVCPLCYCFSIEDRISIDNKKCFRCRNWDTCTLPNFSKVAGGKNFRPALKERYYNWFYHKFVRGYLEYGRSLCIGCARCQKYCPAKIDIEKVLKRIVSEYKKSK